ncbi:MAG: hypothetical protein HGB11_00965 [Chlorobiales bacterium]|nr:hypothetical protein [Chlorobiales bacterium]
MKNRKPTDSVALLIWDIEFAEMEKAIFAAFYQMVEVINHFESLPIFFPILSPSLYDPVCVIGSGA